MADIIRTSLKAPTDAPSKMGDCGIFALATVMGVEHGYVWDWFKARGKGRGNWKGSLKLGDIARFVHAHGIETEVVDALLGEGVAIEDLYRVKRIKDTHGLAGSPAPARMSIAKLAEMEELQDGNVYLVLTTGHLQLMYNGLLMDQNTGELVEPKDYPTRRKRVKLVCRLANVVTPATAAKIEAAEAAEAAGGEESTTEAAGGESRGRAQKGQRSGQSRGSKRKRAGRYRKRAGRYRKREDRGRARESRPRSRKRHRKRRGEHKRVGAQSPTQRSHKGGATMAQATRLNLSAAERYYRLRRRYGSHSLTPDQLRCLAALAHEAASEAEHSTLRRQWNWTGMTMRRWAANQEGRRQNRQQVG